MLELVAEIQAVAGTTLEPDIQNNATHEIDEQFLSAAKAKRVLGWSPTLTMREALEETVGWYREYLDQGIERLRYRHAVTAPAVRRQPTRHHPQGDGDVRPGAQRVDYLPEAQQHEIDPGRLGAGLAEAFAGVDAVVHLAGLNEVVASQEPDRALAETAVASRHVATAARPPACAGSSTSPPSTSTAP